MPGPLDARSAAPLTRTVCSGDVRLHVAEHGAPSASSHTIVLLHGYPDTSSVWDRVVPLLSTTYHVVVYDVRGAGRSTRPARVRDYAFEHLMADLRAVIHAVRPGAGVHLVGHDWGAIQGWEAACDPRTAGALASFTAVSAPSLDLSGPRARPGTGGAGALAVLDQLWRSWYVGAFQVPGLGALPWRAGLGRRWAEIRRRIERDAGLPDPDPTIMEDGIAGVRLYRANAGRLLFPVRSQVRVPTRVLVGEHDRFVAPTTFAGLGPNVDVRVVRGAGHWLPLTHPQVVAQQASRATG